MDLNDNRRIELGPADPERKPLTWSDAPPSGNADPILWEHEITPPARPRAASGRGQIIAAVMATGVFLGTGFAIGAPIYALSRWWASKPVATATHEWTRTVAGQPEDAPPSAGSPPAAAARDLVLDEELLTVAMPVVAVLQDPIAPEEAPPSPEPPAEVLASEPPPAEPVQSEILVPAASIVDSSDINVPTIEGVTIDPVPIARVTIDPVPIARVTIDPVVIQWVTIDPVPIERVNIDPVLIHPVAIDRVTIDPVPINGFVSGPTNN